MKIVEGPDFGNLLAGCSDGESGEVCSDQRQLEEIVSILLEAGGI